MLYRLLFFLPLFEVEFSTVLPLTLLASIRVTAYTCWAVAGMFAVFIMTWKKIVRRVPLSGCPNCGNGGFDLEPGEDLEDYEALVRCGNCGHVCRLNQVTQPVQKS